MTIAEAYRVCREIARREAKNFYYAFRVLPQQKSDAMCAVYAFMRKADDLADDESYSIAERRVQMEAWTHAWAESRRGGVTEDAIFVALRDTQLRFGIPDELLEELVQGTAMDLELSTLEEGRVQTYADFDELYDYCYLVASVVGLVCIRIFGYSDPRAEKLAEETGIAFQLTNILRDVKEDIERRRVYLPLDLMEEFGVSIDRLKTLASGAEMHGNERSMLFTLVEQAECYYSAAQELLPLIEADSRAALWVLVTIYHRLLMRIAACDGDVFSRRVSVPTAEKIWILSQGAGRAFWNRLTL